MAPADASALLAAQLGPGWAREHRFAREEVGDGPGIRTRLRIAGLRDWRFDFSHHRHRVAVEIEGGGWSGGRHTRGPGFAEDLRKYAAAQRLGWRVIRVSPEMVRSGEALATVREVLRHAAS
jgi:very-short-patch-repair endonuclease